MNEGVKRQLAVPITGATIGGIAIALIGWLAINKVESLEQADADIKADVKVHGERIAQHGQAIAVTDSRYAEILRRLDELHAEVKELNR